MRLALIRQRADPFTGGERFQEDALEALLELVDEALEALVVPMMGGYDAFFAPATSVGKNVSPRIAAKLDGSLASQRAR